MDYVIGDLSAVNTYATFETGMLDGAAELDITDDHPAAGTAFYYLVKYRGACGTWQTLRDAEPERDTALP